MIQQLPPADRGYGYTLALYEPETTVFTEKAAASAAQPALLAAQNDIEAVRAWLAQYVDSPNTFHSYRKEAERLLLWAQMVPGKPLAALRHEDFLQFRYFLANPEPASLWVMSSGRRFPRHHPDWRPFAGPLAASSIQQALTILHNLFHWLHTAHYLPANPLALLRRTLRTPQHQSPNQRYIPQRLWQDLLQTISRLPQNTASERAHYHRTRWVFSILYGCGLRVSELCAHCMGDFMAQYEPTQSTPQWWLEIIGKGRKKRRVPVTRELMSELALYRKSHQLSPTPQPHEPTPLVLPLRYSGAAQEQPALSRARIYSIVRELCTKAAEQLRDHAPERADEADLLEQVSPHWLRHTAGTHMVENEMDLIEVRDTLGHSSLTTTNQYLHTSFSRRHHHTEQKHKLRWPEDVTEQ